ncbi:hypothetical protein V1509DRAFT_628239 [Lipomyces kononenkoae]
MTDMFWVWLIIMFLRLSSKIDTGPGKSAAKVIAVSVITVLAMACINCVHEYINSAADTCKVRADGGNTLKCVNDIFFAIFTAFVGAIATYGYVRGSGSAAGAVNSSPSNRDLTIGTS